METKLDKKIAKIVTELSLYMPCDFEKTCASIKALIESFNKIDIDKFIESCYNIGSKHTKEKGSE